MKNKCLPCTHTTASDLAHAHPSEIQPSFCITLNPRRVRVRKINDLFFSRCLCRDILHIDIKCSKTKSDISSVICEIK